MAKFLVPVLVVVEATGKQKAIDEVRGLMDYAFEVSNDDGNFKDFVVADKADVKKASPAV